MKKVSSRILLLDVNVLLALAWPNHPFHAAARRRMESRKARWASCALTQLGFIRISSNRAAIPDAKSPAAAAQLLSEMVTDPLHVFFEALPPPVSEGFVSFYDWTLGPQQVTDAYLLSLARHHEATLLTFDTRLNALATSDTHTEVLAP